MKKIPSTIKNHIVLFLLVPILGLLALLLVHMLPTDPMRENVYWSIDMIEEEFTDELLINGYKTTLTGNFTDSLMLQYAVYSNDEHSALEQVLHMYRKESYYDESNPDGWWPGHSLKDYLENIPQPREVEYSRYWHGYLVLLKPLLLLTSFNTIRLLNSALQLIAIGFVIMSLCKRNAYPIAKAFVISLPFLFFVSTYASLSLSICLYLMTVALLFQLRWADWLNEKKLYGEFFLLVGMATSFFDLLTYPLITLAYPLCVYLYFHGSDLLNSFKKIIKNSAEWFMGYIGMWAAKWLLTDLLTDSTTIKDAIDTILTRTQGVESTSRLGGLFEVTALNLQPFGNWCYLLLGLAIAVWALVALVKTGIRKAMGNARNGITFFVVALYPLLWYLVTQNHSMEHWQFTCRILSVTVFAAVIGLHKILEIDKP